MTTGARKRDSRSYGHCRRRECSVTRAIVVGGSLGGLTAALILRDQGWDVDVLERSPIPPEGRGTGIVAHPITIRYLVERVGKAAGPRLQVDGTWRVGEPAPFGLHVTGDSALPADQGQKGNTDGQTFGPRRSA
jgi:glycine/D-amino acid oxidase-like deaminating enzyme